MKKRGCDIGKEDIEGNSGDHKSAKRCAFEGESVYRNIRHENSYQIKYENVY